MAAGWLGARLGVCNGGRQQNATAARGVLGPAAARLDFTGPITIHADQSWDAGSTAQSATHAPCLQSATLDASLEAPAAIVPSPTWRLYTSKVRDTHVDAPMHATGLFGARHGECPLTKVGGVPR